MLEKEKEDLNPHPSQNAVLSQVSVLKDRSKGKGNQRVDVLLWGIPRKKNLFVMSVHEFLLKSNCI